MPNDTRTFKLGDARITIINAYDIPTKLDELIKVPEAEAASPDVTRLKVSEDLPVQCIYIQTPERSVLVDAGAYEAEHDSSGQALVEPPPDLLSRLAKISVTPADVHAVVITHLHGDHYNATTVEGSMQFEPAFPNARCYVGRPDWEAPSLREALDNPTSLESRSLGVLDREELLVPVDGQLDLGGGITILPAPGETPGHQMVRVQSKGETLYCVGDLYHHPLEAIHPTWMVPWADRGANLASRQAMEQAAADKNVAIVATHIPGVGQLKRTNQGMSWVSLA